jgi:hypothetical protein
VAVDRWGGREVARVLTPMWTLDLHLQGRVKLLDNLTAS